MSYPPPPGLKSSQPSAPQPSSLPARPPPPSGPQPSFPLNIPGSRGYGGAGGATSNGAGFGGFTGFQPRAVAAAQNNFTYRTASPTVSVGPAPPTGFSAPNTNPAGAAYQQPYQTPSAAPSYYPPANNFDDTFGQSTSQPQIRNPFAPPSQNAAAGGRGGAGYGAVSYDPEMEAQIAQWQSAYAGKEDFAGGANSRGARARYGEGSNSATGANSGPLGSRLDSSHLAPAMSTTDISSAANADSGVAAVVTGADGKQKTVIRSGGGQTWQDPSLLEWDPAHFRLFVGNLAGEVTDESLMKAFAKYGSLEKARVVRDKRTTKSKGYGFVSFRDGDDYFQAAREMQGKYIGSHPVLLRKSTTEIKAVVPKDDRGKNGKKGGKGGGHGGGHGGGGGDRTGAGVHKKQNKTKGGLKILG